MAWRQCSLNRHVVDRQTGKEPGIKVKQRQCLALTSSCHLLLATSLIACHLSLCLSITHPPCLSLCSCQSVEGRFACVLCPVVCSVLCTDAVTPHVSLHGSHHMRAACWVSCCMLGPLVCPALCADANEFHGYLNRRLCHSLTIPNQPTLKTSAIAYHLTLSVSITLSPSFISSAAG